MAETIEQDKLVLVGESSSQGATAGKMCYFQAYDGTFSEQDNVMTFYQYISLCSIDYLCIKQGRHCDRHHSFTAAETDHDDHNPVHYTCKKKAACGNPFQFEVYFMKPL